MKVLQYFGYCNIVLRFLSPDPSRGYTKCNVPKCLWICLAYPRPPKRWTRSWQLLLTVLEHLELYDEKFRNSYLYETISWKEYEIFSFTLEGNENECSFYLTRVMSRAEHWRGRWTHSLFIEGSHLDTDVAGSY